MRHPDQEAARVAKPVQRVLLVGLTAGFLLVTAGVVAAVLGRPMSCTCPPPCEALRLLCRGDCCGLIALGLLLLMITPPMATLAISAGFLRVGRRWWTVLCVAVVLVSLTGLVIRLK